MNCNMCGGGDVDIYHYGTRETPDRDLIKCHDCGVGFLSDFTHIDDEFYKSDGILQPKKGSTPKERIKHFAEENKARFERFKYLVPNKRVLDFGCGSGGFALQIKDIAEEVVGVEPSGQCREFLNQAGIRCYKNLINVAEHANLNDENKQLYDIVFAFHVFEHLQDPVQKLRDLARLTKKDGWIFIEVPNFMDDVFSRVYEQTHRDLGYMQFNVNDPHLWYFNKRSLTYLALEAGVDVDFVEYIQRYSFANHLFWLATGLPGGHKEWFFLDSPQINDAYTSKLKELGMTDAIMIALRP